MLAARYVCHSPPGARSCSVGGQHGAGAGAVPQHRGIGGTAVGGRPSLPCIMPQIDRGVKPVFHIRESMFGHITARCLFAWMLYCGWQQCDRVAAMFSTERNAMAGKKRRTATDMGLLTPEQQAERIQRLYNRKKIRQANRVLATLVLSWVVGRQMSKEEFMEQFNARGHAGQYHEMPGTTTFHRVSYQLAELSNITQRLKDTPLDYMGAIELAYVYERITRMIALLKTHAGGTSQQAIELYEQVGSTIRAKVFAEMGHYPEQFPIPRGRITGEESERQFKVTDYQPPLFEEE
jgi:hypothetical protein